MKNLLYSIFVSILFLLSITSCGPLNPVNDFFGIQMNPTEEANFIIVDYSDIDGVSYKNSVSMNPKISAWAEFSADIISLKVTNNSTEEIQLNYTADQFILITDDKEFYLGKGERAEYFKKGMISPNSSANFILEYPNEHSNIAQTGGTYVDGAKTTRDVLRNYSKVEGKIMVPKEDIKYFVVKFGKISLVLKRVP